MVFSFFASYIGLPSNLVYAVKMTNCVHMVLDCYHRLVSLKYVQSLFNLVISAIETFIQKNCIRRTLNVDLSFLLHLDQPTKILTWYEKQRFNLKNFQRSVLASFWAGNNPISPMTGRVLSTTLTNNLDGELMYNTFGSQPLSVAAKLSISDFCGGPGYVSADCHIMFFLSAFPIQLHLFKISQGLDLANITLLACTSPQVLQQKLG